MEITTSPVYAAALNCARHGWAVIPVHGLIASLPEKRCTCNRFPCGPGNANAGKHPVRGGWTTGPPMSAADIYAAWVEEGPDWNVGIRTGEASGFFVVDVDPKAGGHHELTRLERYNGQLPVTRTVRTGSMGRHFYFRMPDFAIRNNARKIADGIDIRGTGGMIVAPPSVSGIGPYDLITDAPIVTAPAWLLDLLRLPEGFDPGETVVVEDLPAYLDLDSETQHRVSRYALSVLEAEARTYAEAPPGTGNAQLFRSTCNMLEIVQSPWNQLTADDVVRMLDRAREQRTVMRPDGGQGPDEFRKTVQSARSKVVGTGRQLPPEPANGVLFDAGISVPLAGPVVGADVTTGNPLTSADTPGDTRGHTGWIAEDLTDVLSGTRIQVKPELGVRTDGVRLLYPGKEHAVAGEPESGKTWFALKLVRDVLVADGRVMYVDFEDDANTVVGRLLDLGVLANRLAPGAGQFRYIRPETMPLPGDVATLLTFPKGPADLLVYDGWTEGAALMGQDIMSQDDIARWRQALVKPALRMGTATLTTDHVVKDKDTRGRYGIGAQHKLAGLTGVMFMMEAVETWGRGSKGRSKVLVTKDRNGGLRPHGKPYKPNVTHIGDLVGDATSGEMASLLLWPPFEDEAPEDGGPPPALANMVEQVSKILRDPKHLAPLGFREIKDRVTGAEETLRKTLVWLWDEKLIEIEDGPGRRKLHTWIGQNDFE